MASTMWIAIGAICVTAILVRGIVSIIAVSKTGGGKSGTRVADLENQVNDLEADLADAKQRIEVLEKIVTDHRYDLNKQIDDLAANE